MDRATFDTPVSGLGKAPSRRRVLGRLARAGTAAALGAAVFLGAAAATTLAAPLDSDNDALSDEFENLLGTSAFNWDTDGDSLGDGYETNTFKTMAWDADSDNDGFDDGEEFLNGTDPAVLDASASPPPSGSEGRPDGDNDGLFDDDERFVYGTNPDVCDTDRDGSGDGEEVYFGTDPLGSSG
jgi:hypothetical protein